MKILIIGGSRFVGPVLIQKLLDHRHDITIFNRGVIKTEYPEGMTYIQGDRNKEITIDGHFDTVVDMCAYNGKQTQTALDSLHFDHFVHLSSAAVYKKTEVYPHTEESEIGEWPVWGEYNRGKVESELVLKAGTVNHASIRPVYILGTHNYCDRENFIYAQINNDRKIILPGNGEAVCQFVFKEEVAETFLTIIEQSLTGIYNCAGNDLVTLNGLVEYMGRILNKKPMIAYNKEADGAYWIENEFPFANENFICTNEKAKGVGIQFRPLYEQLQRDFQSYYKDTLEK